MASRRLPAAAATLAALSVLAAVLWPPAAASGSAADGWLVPSVRIQPLNAAAPVQVGGVGEFRGAVDVVRSGSGLAAVNDVPLEEYLLGISEVPASWPLEAQRAQAIAARTYALHMMGGTAGSAFRAAGAHICATQACQVYMGLDGERRRGAGAWREAVQSTAGQVLLYGGVPIRAKYSSSNGGHTAAGGAPYLPAVPDPDDAAVSPYASWQSPLTLSELDTAVPGDGQLVAVWTAPPGVVLGRHLEDGSTLEQIVPQAELRGILNGVLSPRPNLPVPVPSPFFTARSEGDMVLLDGRGYGHGVGMSQYGALGKARRGMAAADILASYYAGLTPVSPPPDQVPDRIRVAVALDRGALTVASPAPFRVAGPDGAALAHAAARTWRLAPEGDGIRVTPAAEEAASPAVELLGLEPEAAHPGQEVRLRFRIAAPAVVRIRRGGAGSPPLELGLLAAGEHRATVAAPPVPGGAIVVEADVGGGRVGSAAAHVAAPTTTTDGPPAGALAGASAPARSPSRPVLAALAAVLVAAVGAAAARGFRRRSPGQAGHR